MTRHVTTVATGLTVDRLLQHPETQSGGGCRVLRDGPGRYRVGGVTDRQPTAEYLDIQPAARLGVTPSPTLDDRTPIALALLFFAEIY